jgi:Bacterial archaeo-eukaryotic release factor family 10
VRDVRRALRALAEIEPGELPVLSVYLDMRPHATGESPALRAGTVVLRKRLREIEKTYLPRGPELDSIRADAARIDGYLDDEYDVAADGLALFACDGRDVFETVETGAPFQDQVTVAPQPDLFQLARLVDDHETAVVAVVDSNTSRLFATRRGVLREVGGADQDPKYFRTRPMVGGLNQASYQRHNAGLRAQFARETAAELERLVDAEGASRVVLAGDEVAIPLLRDALSPRVADLVKDVLRLHIRAPLDTVAEEVEQVLAAAEAEDGQTTADVLVGSVRAGGLGVAGLDETRAALEHGQVDELLLDPAAELDEATRGELVRLAQLTSATVEVVEGHDGLQRLGGVGALLRYRHD